MISCLSAVLGRSRRQPVPARLVLGMCVCVCVLVDERGGAVQAGRAV